MWIRQKSSIFSEFNNLNGIKPFSGLSYIFHNELASLFCCFQLKPHLNPLLQGEADYRETSLCYFHFIVRSRSKLLRSDQRKCEAIIENFTLFFFLSQEKTRDKLPVPNLFYHIQKAFYTEFGACIQFFGFIAFHG